jgi:hypothetical protein
MKAVCGLIRLHLMQWVPCSSFTVAQTSHPQMALTGSIYGYTKSWHYDLVFITTRTEHMQTEHHLTNLMTSYSPSISMHLLYIQVTYIVLWRT